MQCRARERVWYADRVRDIGEVFEVEEGHVVVLTEAGKIERLDLSAASGGEYSTRDMAAARGSKRRQKELDS